jgi:hypothetical protein
MRLAAGAFFSAAIISRIETGQAMVSIPTLQTCANTLIVNISHFFKDELDAVVV